MNYFSYLTEFQQKGIFYLPPQHFSKTSSKEMLAYSLGATLYMPATRSDIAQLVLTSKYRELVSMVICLEDAIGDDEVEQGEKQLVEHLHYLLDAVQMKRCSEDSLPLIFIRVRTPEQIQKINQMIGSAMQLVAGFVFPKFTPVNAPAYLSYTRQVATERQTVLYGMPVLETEDVLYKEHRFSTFEQLATCMKGYEDLVLNIRLGATDFCGLYGIRRTPSTTIYDISMMRDVIADIVNFFGRTYVVSGPVWEYFQSSSNILPNNPYDEGLKKETLLDLVNGLHGKTVIHPSQMRMVQALNVVSKEEYLDALAILSNGSNEMGVVKSDYGNKMNEMKPHYKWATKIMLKSKIYGVFHENNSYQDLLAEEIYV
ncbi:HpcH/HpaI aldolase/citrate lyase family protein [Bacillus sp. CGMCC 1.16541]|uniref:HpcH/HpaI aldolase/citrate lyase family protein n=1 Tax=Bacillus sp. CGMCC 1.16541 TaxID=2185143 RepID=UPI000D73E0AD|nr:HpcH/HpaI aldolase/citrate lyase family protein [Bacillus sp. CGMCC 1.16541]